MIRNRLLTFERTPNPESLEIYCDGEGLLDLIHYLSKLAGRDPHMTDHDHWMAESIGGHDLTAQKQGLSNALYEMVTAHYIPPGKESKSQTAAAGRLLTIIAGPPGGECEIFGDFAGLHRLIDRLRTLASGDSTRPFSDIWTTTSPDGGMLTDENWAKRGTLVKQVTLHYRP